MTRAWRGTSWLPCSVNVRVISSGRAAEAVAGAVGDCFGHDFAAGDGEALHRHAVAEVRQGGLRRLAVSIEDGDQVDERAAAAAGDEDDDGGVGEAVTVEVSEGDGVVDDAGVDPFCCALAEGDLALAVGELNGGVFVAEERQVVLGVAQLVQRQALRDRRFPGKLLAVQPLLQALGAVDPRLLTVGKPGPVVGFAPGELAVGGGLLRQPCGGVVLLVVQAVANDVRDEVVEGLEAQLEGAVLGKEGLEREDEADNGDQQNESGFH